MISLRNRLLLLLLISIHLDWCNAQKSHHGRRRRPIDIVGGRSHPMGDQIALANTWQSSNRVISASYAENPDTGLVNHANLVVSLLPTHRTPMPSAKDFAIAEQLANTRTAAEYVNEAMRMRSKHHLKVPQSSYVKYDVYKKQKTKLFKPSSGEESEEEYSNEYNQIDPPAVIKYIVGSNPNEEANPATPVATTRMSKFNNDYVYSPRKPDYHNNVSLGGHGGQLYTSYGTTYKGHYDKESKDGHVDSDEDAKKKESLPKHEIIQHIQESVIRYMEKLEAEGKLSPTPTQSSPDVIKTYYRFPTSTPTPDELHNDYVRSTLRYVGSSDGPSEYFKYPPGATYSPATTHQTYTNEILPSMMTPASHHLDQDHNATPNIDLTFRSKARPKPIDLAALDVGQSWSHDSEQLADAHQSHKKLNHQKHQQKKLKEQLNFDAQTYHDINSMGSHKTKSYPEHSTKVFHKTTSSHDQLHKVTPVRFKDELHSTGHHSVAAPPEDFNEDTIKEMQQHYRSPIHVINGIPVVNPYKFNMQQLNQLFGEQKEHRAQDESESNEYIPTKDHKSGWKPSFSITPSFTKPQREPADHHAVPSYHHSKPKPSKSSTFHHNLPFDSYNPKYNNNPDGDGYQQDYRESDLDQTSHIEPHSPLSSSDLYSSSSSKRAKKTPIWTAASTSHKVQVRPKTHGKKNRSLVTDLRPPPPA